MIPDISSVDRIQGWMSTVELEWLASHARTCNLIIEIGSWKGRSTKALAMYTPGVVFAVDHWRWAASDDNSVGRQEVALKGADGLFAEFLTNLTPELHHKKVIPVRAESGEAVSILRETLGDRRVDMVFIDGDHAYDSVKRDIRNYRPFLREGGLLSGHDYSYLFPGVMRAVDEMRLYKSVIDNGSIWHCVV